MVQILLIKQAFTNICLVRWRSVLYFLGTDVPVNDNWQNQEAGFHCDNSGQMLWVRICD